MSLRTLVRPLAVIAVVAIWLGIAAVGGMTFGKLGSVQENNAAVFLPETAESTEAAAYHAQFITDPAIPGLFVVKVEAQADLAAVEKFAQEAAAADLPHDPQGRTVQEVLAAPPVVVPSEDGEALLVTFSIPADLYSQMVDEDQLGQLVAEAINATWDAQENGLSGYLTGPLGFVADLLEAFAGIDGLLLVVALSVVFVILLIVYRSPVLPLLVLTTALIALTGAIVVVYELARNGVILLNGQAQGIMFILVVGATTDYALLMVARYREELLIDESPYRAIKIAWRQTVEPIAASAGTVMAGLLVLLVSDLKSLQSLGPAGAVGIAASLLAALTLLPALLLIGGERARLVFWPRRPLWRGADAQALSDSVEAVEERAGAWGRVSRFVYSRPRRVWVLSSIFLIVLAAFLPTLKLGGVGDRDYFVGEVDSQLGYDLLAEHFDAGASAPIRVIVPQGDLGRALEALSEVPGIVAAYPLTPAVAAGAPGGVVPEDPIVAAGRVELLGITQVAASTAEAQDIVAAVRTYVQAVSPQALVGGDAAEALDTRLTTTSDATKVIPLVLAVVLVVLILLLRAIVAPVIIVVANVVSFGAAIGLSALVFNGIFKFPGVDSATVLFAFVFLIALGVDYSIFLTSRAREESLAHGTKEGARRALAVTGGVITSAGIVLAATFSALAVIPLLFMAQIAFIVAVGVLIDTFVVRSLLVPGVMIDAGKRVWAPWAKGFKD